MRRNLEILNLSVMDGLWTRKVPKSKIHLETFISCINHTKNILESAFRFAIGSILKDEIGFPCVVMIGHEYT